MHLSGLTAAQVHERQARLGANTLPETEGRSLFTLFREALFDPMFSLLLGAALLHLLLGELRDSATLLIAVAIVIGLSIRQEWKSERALRALRDLSAPFATVIRDRKVQRISSTDLVDDDLLVLEAGDRVGADAQLISATDIFVDESLLTGESIPVEKGRSGAWVFGGTIVTRGRGLASVKSIGIRSEVGKLGKSLKEIARITNPIEENLRSRLRKFAWIAIGICSLVSLLHVMRSGDWLQGALAGLALAIALIPEEFPVVTKVFLAMGAWRLTAHKVLTRNLSSLATMAYATVLCVDKTGTLTANRIKVHRLIPLGGSERELLVAAEMASEKHSVDPVDQAICNEASAHLKNQTRGTPVKSVPLAMAMVHVYPSGDGFEIFAKGAPEVIASLCALSEAQRAYWQKATVEAAEEGLKVLGVARAVYRAIPDKEELRGMHPCGLICLLDPIRPDVPAAVEEAYAAGVRVLVITGDHAATAVTIARQAGIKVERVITGQEMEVMPEAELLLALRQHTLFSRVAPSQKLEIVTLLKSAGETVVMTGDGVNDAPALKAADVGVAMGKRGTDVARETADLVLMEDDFGSLVDALRTARGIWKKLRRAVAFIVAVHIPIATLAVLPFVFGWPLILLPLHVVLLELVIDPVCAIVFDGEPDPADLMSLRPQVFHTSLFDRQVLLTGLLQGIAACMAVVGVFILSFRRVGDPVDSRTLAFSTLLLADLSLAWMNRSRSRTFIRSWITGNKLLWIVSAGVVAFLLVVKTFAGLREPLRLTELHGDDYVLILGGVLCMVTILESLGSFLRATGREAVHT